MFKTKFSRLFAVITLLLVATLVACGSQPTPAPVPTPWIEVQTLTPAPTATLTSTPAPTPIIITTLEDFFKQLKVNGWNLDNKFENAGVIETGPLMVRYFLVTNKSGQVMQYGEIAPETALSIQGEVVYFMTSSIDSYNYIDPFAGLQLPENMGYYVGVKKAGIDHNRYKLAVIYPANFTIVCKSDCP